MARFILSGFLSTQHAVLDRLLHQASFTVIQIPQIGEFARSTAPAHLWHDSMNAFMACHPGNIVFLGGVREDHEWLLQRGCMILHCSQGFAIELACDFDPATPRWSDPAHGSLDLKLSRAMQVAEQIASHPLTIRAGRIRAVG